MSSSREHPAREDCFPYHTYTLDRHSFTAPQGSPTTEHTPAAKLSTAWAGMHTLNFSLTLSLQVRQGPAKLIIPQPISQTTIFRNLPQHLENLVQISRLSHPGRRLPASPSIFGVYRVNGVCFLPVYNGARANHENIGSS